MTDNTGSTGATADPAAPATADADLPGGDELAPTEPDGTPAAPDAATAVRDEAAAPEPAAAPAETAPLEPAAALDRAAALEPAAAPAAPPRPAGPPGTRVTVLGTGAMGYGMAVSLLRAGLATTVWNRTRAKAEPLAQLGAVVADEPTDAVRDADVVLTVLFDAEAVAEVMTAALPALPRGAAWVQSATVGAEGTARLAELADAHGVAFVDAPVLGTRKPALAGRLVVLAAGPDVARPLVAPVLDAIAERTVWVADEPGPASRLKLVANAWIATLTAGVAQSVALARAWDLDPQLFLDAIDGGAPDSPYAHIKGAAMLSGDFEPQFQLDGLRKDLALIVADARRAGVPTALVDTLARAYAVAAGADDEHGDQDIAAVIGAFRPAEAAGAPSDQVSRRGRHSG